MSLFARAKGRHTRSHFNPASSCTGWGGLARIAVDAAAHPVVDARISRPVSTRTPAPKEIR